LRRALEGSDIDRPHGTAQGPALGSDDHSNVTAIHLALMAYRKRFGGRPAVRAAMKAEGLIK
jgi:hypothetical protein